MSPGPHWHPLTPRPLGGGRGGVEQGAPHSPCYLGPMVGGWGGARVVCRKHVHSLRMLAGDWTGTADKDRTKMDTVKQGIVIQDTHRQYTLEMTQPDRIVRKGTAREDTLR
jgi:hypothetical protein